MGLPASLHGAHTSGAAPLLSLNGLRTDTTAVLASLHGLHTDGAGATALFWAFSGSLGLSVGHDDPSVMSMGAPSVRDFARPDDMASDSARMVFAGGANMGTPHACY